MARKKKVDEELNIDLNILPMKTEVIKAETEEGTEEFSIIKLTADEGKVFQRISDGMILMGSTLYLGVNDKAENYTVIDKPDETAVSTVE